MRMLVSVVYLVNKIYLVLMAQRPSKQLLEISTIVLKCKPTYSKVKNAILQNASATGGLRGGNTQAALAQFRPQLLNQLINQRYQNLAGMTSLGQNAAAGTGNAGMQSASNISNLYQQSGAAQAGAALASGQASANMWNSVGSAIGTIGGMKLTGMF